MTASLLDTERTFHTPEQTSYTYRVAGPMARALAYLLDSLLVLAVMFCLFLVLIFASLILGLRFSNMEEVALGILLVVWFFAQWLLPGMVEYMWRGRTPGKAALNIRSVTMDGQPPSIGACMLRTLLRFADGIPTVALGLTVMVMNRDFRRLGDFAAGTMVVYSGEQRRFKKPKKIELNKRLLKIMPQVPEEVYAKIDREAGAAIASYMDRRRRMGEARREEIASHFVKPLREVVGGLPKMSADDLIQILYYQLFLNPERQVNQQVRKVMKRHRKKWDALQDLAGRFLRRSKKKTIEPGISSEFASLYRSTGADLALLEHASTDIKLTQELQRVVGQSHVAFYPRSLPSKTALYELVFRKVPGMLYADGCVRVAMLGFCGMFLVAMSLGVVNPQIVADILGEDMVDNMRDMYRDHPSDRDFATATYMQGFYIMNNVGISLMCFAAGIFAGLGSLLFLVFNGIVLGLVFGFMITVDPSTRSHFFEFVTAHGPFELTGIVLSGAAGMRMGLGLFASDGQSRLKGLQQAAHRAMPILLVAACLVALAAPIEAFVSPSSLSLAGKRSVGILCGIILIMYMGVCGYLAHNARNSVSADQEGGARGY